MRRVRGLLRISLSYNILLLFSTDASIYVSFSPSYIERVATRVREGGHNIPSDVIRRRYANGIKNLTALYIPLCNYWAIYDNSSADEQIRIIALGGKDITTHIEDTLSYKTIADYERN